MRTKNRQIPKEFRPFLWSFDVSKMDLEKDKKRVITNVLNWGTKEATDLLFETYDKEDIKEMVRDPLPGEWSDKSLNYWCIVLGIKPKKTKDVLRHIG